MLSTPVVLFRSDNSDEQNQERDIAKQYFRVVQLRTDVPADSLVIGRYSTLPFYRELELDLKNIGSRLINSLSEHTWIAGFDYYQDLKAFTPRSWTEQEFPYSGYDGPLVLKGRTNSRKQRWSKLMFAPDRRSAIDIASELANDPLIGPQGIIYREYVPLKEFGRCPIYGLPYANEWRLFFYKTELLSAGYYWSQFDPEVKPELAPTGISLAHQVAKIAAEHTTFFVLDIAEKRDGRWILIEINSGQAAGLSENKAEILYGNLAAALAI